MNNTRDKPQDDGSKCLSNKGYVSQDAWAQVASLIHGRLRGRGKTIDHMLKSGNIHYYCIFKL